MQKRTCNIVFTLSALLFISYGCDIFSTRDSEEPDKPRSNFELAYTPDILIDNLINSLSEKNTQNYISAFADSSFTGMQFQFVPSAGSGSQFPVLLEDWGLSEEQTYFNNFTARIEEEQPITLVLSNSEKNLLGDSVIYTASYYITAPVAGSGEKAEYNGELKFKMVRDSRLVWSIFYWQDIKSGESSTWSELKGFYY